MTTLCNSTALIFFFLQFFKIMMVIISPRTSVFSFNFNRFDVGDPINYEGAAILVARSLQLTNQLVSSIGRATYNESLYLWNRTIGNLTDFQTHFSFMIYSKGATRYGDGLTFFLEPEGSKPPLNMSRGSTLGLTNYWQQTNTYVNHFVAVEFDIFESPFDPPGSHEHVGIDIKSLQSAKNISWMTNIRSGKINNAWITYDSNTHNLTVVVTGFLNGALQLQSHSHVIYLRKYLPEKVIFGFTGATGNDTALHSVLSWDFSTTLADENAIIKMVKSKNKIALAVGLGVGGGLTGGIVIVGFVIVLWKRYAEDKDGVHVLDDEFENGTGAKKFSYRELARATNNFKDEKKLGQGGFGGVYKGFLRNMNLYVMVKRVSRGSNQGVKEYAAEVKIISRLRHENLVQLLGWCHERKELLLVYEFLPNGSLDSHLFRENSLLTWEVRYKIAQGLASGLLYLHEEWEQCVVHRDIKSSNIMPDTDFNAKLKDFGLARLVDHGKGSRTTVLAGTVGYMAPECAIERKASRESDVYSFGVVALEIACGRKPIILKGNEDEVHMVSWVWNLYGEGKVLEVANSRLCRHFDEQQMERLLIVSLWCAHPDEYLRPSIRQSIHVLNFEAPLPILPPTMPIPTYLTPLPNPSISYSASGSLTVGQNQSSSYGYTSESSKFTKFAASSNSVSVTSLSNN